MYFATLTEVPILQGLLGSGMGQGPALALLLAGPALSLPSMLVIRSILGTPKTAVFVLLVIVMATATGMLFERLMVPTCAIGDRTERRTAREHFGVASAHQQRHVAAARPADDVHA